MIGNFVAFRRECQRVEADHIERSRDQSENRKYCAQPIAPPDHVLSHPVLLVVQFDLAWGKECRDETTSDEIRSQRTSFDWAGKQDLLLRNKKKKADSSANRRLE
jgi:hypothetical protein